MIFVIKNKIKYILCFNVKLAIIIVNEVDIRIDKINGKCANVYININNKYMWHSNGYRQLKRANGKRHMKDVTFDKIRFCKRFVTISDKKFRTIPIINRTK